MAYGRITTWGDVQRSYIKPSLNGGLVLRKRSTEIASGKKIKRMGMFKEKMQGTGGCVVTARNAAREQKGMPLWDAFISKLTECAAGLKTGTGPATIGRQEYAKAFWVHGPKSEYIKTE